VYYSISQMNLKSRNILKSINLRLKDLYSAIDNSDNIVEKAKYLFLVNELTSFKDIFDEKSSDGKPAPLKAKEVELKNIKINKIRHTLTNHPTNPLGHEATVEMLKMKLAIINGDFEAVSRCMKNFMKIKEPTSKRITEQSGYVINNFLKLRWQTYDFLSEDAKRLNEYGDWLNDADGNPFKTLRVLKKELVDKNKLFQECIVDGLDKIIGSARKGNKKLMEEIKDIYNFEIDENNFLKAEDVSNSLRNIVNSDFVDESTKNKLLKLSKKIDDFGAFMSKPEIRQEGEIFQKAYKLVKEKFRQQSRSIEEYNFSLDEKGNVNATHKTDSYKQFTVFETSEYAQKTDEDGKFIPLEKGSDSVAIDHFAKLVYLKNLSEKTKIEPIIDTFIMSEFKGATEMADTLRLFNVIGIDTKNIRLFPLYEEIDEYKDIKNTINILKKCKKGSELSADEQLVKDYIDKTGKVFLMYAASDTSKRGGAEAYSKMLYHLTKLCDAVVEYNEAQPEDKKLKLSFYWGGGPSQSRGGAIDFIRALKSIAGDRGVETEISYTLQGEGINRISDPTNYVAYEENITQGNKYQASRKIQPESGYVKQKNEGIWRKISGVFNVLGNDLGSTEEKFKSFYESAYGKFAKMHLTNKNPMLNLLSKLAAGVNTADRPDSRTDCSEGTPFFKMLRAIGYDLMGRQAGFNNIIVGHGENLNKFFNELKSGDENVSIDEIKKLHTDSTVFQSQINTYAQIIGMTDFDYAEKLAGTLEDNSNKYLGSRDFISLIKQETMAMAKFTAIALGKADKNTSLEEAYGMIKNEFSNHLNEKNTKIAKDLMKKLFKGIAKGEIDENNLGAHKTVVGACVDTLRSDYILRPTLQQIKDVAKNVNFPTKTMARAYG